jgi:AcrR family transcriptional regulator
MAERCPSDVSMDAVAAAAGVGKGTLFRRFGDRAGLMQALLTERERRFQEEFIRGAPPLGPGAPPVERLVAFGCRLVAHHAEHGELILAAEAHAARYRSAPYAVYRAHVSMLVREAAAEADWEYIADVLLAALAADHIAYLRRVREMDDERIATGWEQLVRRLLSGR